MRVKGPPPIIFKFQNHETYCKIILTVLLLPGLSGCEQPSTSDPKEGNEVSVMLEVLSEQLHTTRAIAESDIDDVNIFIYSDTGGLKQHIYASGASHK